MLILLVLILPGYLMSQQFFTAGPDKETCEGKPVQIGPPDSNPNLCYRWTPKTNLSCSDCPNPIATLQTDAEYTLHITDDDFSSGFSDVMEVVVTFGDITFDASYVKQGTMEKVTATLNKHDGSEFTWDFEGDDFGCMIDELGSNTALITPGNRYGKLTVIARKGNDSECIAKATIEVNAGVKDIVVSDADDSGRKAKAGDTLYVISNPDVNVQVIANSGESFNPPETPKWHAPHSNSIELPDGTINYAHDPIADGDAAFTAGYGAPDYEPTTHVNEIPYHEMAIPHTNLFSKLFPIYTKVIKEEATFKNPVPAPAPQITIEITLPGTELKTSTVENYNDPGWGYKWDVNLNVSLKITGEVYHPVLTKSISYPEFWGGEEIAATKVALAAIGTMQLTAGMVKDPGSEDPDFKVNTVISGDASLALRAQASMTLNIGENWNAVVVGSAIAKAGTKMTWDVSNPDLMIFTPYVNPLSAEIDMYIQRKLEPRDKKTFFPKQTWELVAKFEGTPGALDLRSLF